MLYCKQTNRILVAFPRTGSTAMYEVAERYDLGVEKLAARHSPRRFIAQ